MKNYSIMAADINHIDEICLDIKEQVEKGIATSVLFRMTLVPEGNPVIDKASEMCKAYDIFRDRLREMGVECGILVQASIGHGHRLNAESPFEQYISLKDGERKMTCCPYDEGFREHFKSVMKTLAGHKPQVIMVDDDFRLMGRPGRGCACKLHMNKFIEKYGKSITREELYEHTKKRDAESKKITDIYIETQREALIGAAKSMREGIDSVNPKIPGVFCACGAGGVEFADEIARILAGDGNPAVVRINNGNYTPAGAREISYHAFRAASQTIQLNNNVDVVLAETDTCPQNRYSTSAMSLHTHFVASIMEGAAGAKHWITRLIDFEPKSGLAYRRILGKYSGFYNTLSELVPKIEWLGCNNLISPVPVYGFDNEYKKSCSWAKCVLERLGLPMYYSSKPQNAVFLDGEDAMNFDDDMFQKILAGTVIMSSETAKIFICKGYGKHLGIDVKDWNGANTSFERLHINGKKTRAQIESRQLLPVDSRTVADSTVIHLKDGKEEVPLFPGTTVFKNDLGGTVIVFAGTPDTEFKYYTAFSFLSESRKLQLIRLLSESGNLPIFYPGDEEMYMKAGYINNNEIVCILTNTGFDPVDQVELSVDTGVQSVEYLEPDGKWSLCGFTQNQNIVRIDKPSYTLTPVVFKIK